MKNQKYRIEYFYKHSTMGFSNSITVTAINPETATQIASTEISEVYGSSNMKCFTLKSPILIP